MLEFDKVVFATPPDVVLKLLADPRPDERDRFAAWQVNHVQTLLHADIEMYEPYHIKEGSEFDFFETIQSCWDCDRDKYHLADLNPSRGSEQARVRPVVVVQRESIDRFTQTVVIVPLTSNLRRSNIPGTITIPAEEGGLTQESVAFCYQTHIPLVRPPWGVRLRVRLKNNKIQNPVTSTFLAIRPLFGVGVGVACRRHSLSLENREIILNKLRLSIV